MAVYQQATYEKIKDILPLLIGYVDYEPTALRVMPELWKDQNAAFHLDIDNEIPQMLPF